MIAKVRFTFAGKPAEAVLDDDGRWAAPDAHLTDALNALAEGADRSPAAGRPLRRHAEEAARLLGGTVEFPDDTGTVPGRVY